MREKRVESRNPEGIARPDVQKWSSVESSTESSDVDGKIGDLVVFFIEHTISEKGTRAGSDLVFSTWRMCVTGRRTVSKCAERARALDPHNRETSNRIPHTRINGSPHHGLPHTRSFNFLARCPSASLA